MTPRHESDSVTAQPTIVSHRRPVSRSARITALLGAATMAVGLTIGGAVAEAAGPITRQEVLRRAMVWANNPVPYSMSRYRNGWRTDCSGFVSMVWNLDSSLSTVTLPGVSRRISKGDLETGDVLMKGGPRSAGAAGHVVLFEKWANAAKTRYIGIEQTPPQTKRREIPYPYFGNDQRYLPYRYKKIVDSARPAEPEKPAEPPAAKPKKKLPPSISPSAASESSSPSKSKATPTRTRSTSQAPGEGGDDDDALPRTGSPTVPVLSLGGLLLAAGFVLLHASQRRRSRHRWVAQHR